MKKIVEERKDIVFYIKMYPLKSHPAAYEKAKAIVCEKSLALLEDAHSNKPLPKPNCETAAVDESIKVADKLGVSAVPALLFPDGRMMSGYRDAKAILNLIGN
jgi:thiol:disulfide interchange protein DsbC